MTPSNHVRPSLGAKRALKISMAPAKNGKRQQHATATLISTLADVPHAEARLYRAWISSGSRRFIIISFRYAHIFIHNRRVRDAKIPRLPFFPRFSGRVPWLRKYMKNYCSPRKHSITEMRFHLKNFARYPARDHFTQLSFTGLNTAYYKMCRRLAALCVFIN